MDSRELREKFLNFFEKAGHKILPSFSLIPTDPSVLFTSAGMQPFKFYYLGEKSPYGENVATCQKCFRTSDIDEVGDEWHLTFFEMLGNFSFGGYFKKEAIEWAFEFLIKDCKLKIDKIWITFFKGERGIPPDTDSPKIWQKLGIKKERIFGFGKKDNFWGPTGKEGPCGPTTEIHYELKGPCKKGKDCIPNCECRRFIELWNLVFNEYYQDRDGKLVPLKKKGVDTGMGLERLAMVTQNKNSVFETDLFPKLKENFSLKAKRIIFDHLKSAVFLISEGILPSNVERGYVLRRILRRAIRYGKVLNLPKEFFVPLVKELIGIYKDIYKELKSKETDILVVIQNEKEKFEKVLEAGLRKIKKEILDCKSKNLKELPGKVAFDLYQNYGFPLELTKEVAREEGFLVDESGFQEEFERHKEISRAGAEKKFGGIGKDATFEATKLHTATHLLHAALREILGKSVKQMGSDITPQRLRFDFSFPRKLTEKELKRVEDLVNQKIREDLKVKKEKMPLKKALKEGALAFFKEKYPEIVTVYSIGDFSKEICAGPHVEKTSQLGQFKIVKEESCGAGVRRIRAVLK